MASLDLHPLNKEMAGYRPFQVWSGGRGWRLGNFAALGAADRRGGSVRGERTAASQLVGQASAWSASATQNQWFSGHQLGQVARIKSHGMAGMADLRAFRGAGHHIASFATGARSFLIAVQGDRAQRATAGGVSPLRPAAPAPYPGRAGQTTDLQNSGRGTACGLDCVGAAVRHGPEYPARLMGSGERAPQGAKRGSGAGARRGGADRSGSGFGVCHGAFGQGEAATLGARCG